LAEVHLVVGVGVLALNLVAGAWGGAAWLRDQPSIAFWYMLRAAQVAVVVQVLLGGLLVFDGREAADGLHYVYGILPLPVSLLAETARAGAAQRELGDIDFEDLPATRQRSLALAIVRREMGIMAVSCLVIVFLALRAAGTSTAF
jgi:ABC-type phosphate transport system auxiliary subunit